MHLRISLFFIPALFIALSVAGQHRCLTMERHLFSSADPQYRIRQQEAYSISYSDIRNGTERGIDSVIIIPVVVHVLWNAETENIPDEQIKSQIDVLNEDYGAYNSNIVDVPGPWKSLVHESRIRFCLARQDSNGNPTSGIIRRQTSVSEFAIQDNRVYNTSLGGSSGWPRNRYMNIWVCRLEGNALGYSSFPGAAAGEDGVVISFKAFGRVGASLKTPYNFGRTTTHEVGHWLNLFHIWGDDNGTCTISDNIPDTPDQADAHFRCTSFPSTDLCSPVSPGVMFMNYMDYTDDACMSFFTPGQTQVMRNTLYGVRSTLLASQAKNYKTVNGTEASIDSVLNPCIEADQKCFNPVVRVYNNGTDTLFNLQLRYRLNEGLNKHFTSHDLIPPGAYSTITLDPISAPVVDRLLEITLMLNDSIRADNYVSVSLRMGLAAENNCRQTSPFIYPNPVGVSQLACLKTNYPETRNVTVNVYDLSGRNVISRELEINPGDALPFDMRPLRAGMYLAEISSEQSTETLKFIYNPDDHSSGYGYVCN